MDYHAFKIAVTEELQKKLEPEVKVSFYEIKKNNGILMESIALQKEGEAASPLIYLEEHYNLWLKGEPLEEIVDRMVYLYHHQAFHPKLKEDFFHSYEELKENIFFRIVNYEKNKEMLQDMPHKRIMDLAMIFYYRMPDTVSISSIAIQWSHMDLWGISEEELVKNALVSTCSKFPAEVTDMSQIVGYDSPMDMYVVTNEERIFGAGTIFYPGVLEKLERMLGDCFCALPSSIHEWIVIPYETIRNMDELLAFVTEINRECVDPQEVLADQVYVYWSVDKRLHPWKK